ncbi:hypothetical protein [Algibacter pacificus]|uniref:hypothetical protein n=1 Tax=Algibacter pacificus TaxID=2599389 RepID=UPI0011C80DEC|nr:hypothetical protein [Algibacter pacificus]
MKKLIIIALAFIGLQATAQRQEGGPRNQDRGGKMMNLSAEEIATLQTKKMTLFLDLDEGQQKKIYKINVENATQRKAMMEERKAKKEAGTAEKPSKEDHLKMMNAMLDKKIAEKAEMKKILNDDQYAKWEKEIASKKNKRKSGKKGHKDGDKSGKRQKK